MREQIQRLPNRPSADVALGKLSSGVATPPKLQALAPTETQGQKLAKVFNVGLQTAGLVVQDNNKKQAALDEIEYTANATDFARRKVEESITMSNDEKISFFDKAHDEYVQVLRGQGVSEAGLGAGLKTITNKFASAQESAFSNKMRDTMAQLTDKAFTTLQEKATQGIPPQGLVDWLQQDLGIGKAEAGKMYVQGMSGYILEQVQQDMAAGTLRPFSAYQKNIDGYLKITTKDGVRYSTHPVYGKMIDQLEGAVQSALKAHTTKLKGAVYQKTYTAIQGLDVSNPRKVMEMQANIAQAAGSGMFTNTEWNQLNTLLDKAKNGELIDDVYTQVEAVKSYVLRNRISGEKITSEWLASQGINNPVNRQEILTLAKGVTTNLQTEEAKTFLTSIINLGRQGPIEFDMDLRKRLNSMELDYRTRVARGEKPSMVYKDLMTVYEMNTRVSDMNENAAKEKNKQKIIKERDTLSRRLNTAKTLEEKQAISQQIRGLAEQLQKIEGN